ncbi:MAG: DNA-directed RNA polymerase [Candidatus Aenigmatarchaeota archaeon]
MYKVLTAVDEVRVPPTKFDLDMEDGIKKSLAEQIEGKIDPETGVFLAVTEILDIGEGRIIPEDGAVHYKTKFKVLAFVPELNEMLPGLIVDITEFGAFARIGPLDALIHVSQIMDDKISYNPKTANIIGKKTGKKVSTDDIIRARIVGVSLGTGGRSKISLTMRQPTLGVLDWIDKEKRAARKDAKKEK